MEQQTLQVIMKGLKIGTAVIKRIGKHGKGVIVTHHRCAEDAP